MKKVLTLITTLLFVLTLSACTDLCVGDECSVENEGAVITETCDLPEINYDGDCVDPSDICEDGLQYVNGECKPEPVVCNEGEVLDNGACVEKVEPVATTLLHFEHINGHGVLTMREAPILYEYELGPYVKYQVSYLSCTCRDADLNYWQVMYVEIEKSTNRIMTISFGSDGGHYTPGTWGDSSPTPGNKTLENFEDEFIPWLVSQDMETLAKISVFKNETYNGIDNEIQITDAGVDGNGDDMIDAYTGSSVSTNNMIRIMNVLLAYHDEKY